MIPLLENLHDETLTKGKVDVFEILNEGKGQKGGDSYLEVMKKAKSISTKKK